MHAGMADHLDERFDLIFLYGSEMQALKRALDQSRLADRVHFFSKEEKAALITQLQKELQPTDSIVLKGSNGMAWLR